MLKNHTTVTKEIAYSTRMIIALNDFPVQSSSDVLAVGAHVQIPSCEECSWNLFRHIINQNRSNIWLLTLHIRNLKIRVFRGGTYIQMEIHRHDIHGIVAACVHSIHDQQAEVWQKPSPPWWQSSLKISNILKLHYNFSWLQLFGPKFVSVCTL